MIEAPAPDLLRGDWQIVAAYMRGDWDGPSLEAYQAASERIEANKGRKARLASAPNSLIRDAQIVNAWARGDDHGPSPADYIAASRRIEAVWRVGDEVMETQEVVEGRKNPEDHSGSVGFLYPPR